MRYLGGKSRLSKELVPILQQYLEKCDGYWEPFVGGANIVSKVITDKPRWASDVHSHLIDMYKALQNGWEPPSIVSFQEYENAKNGLLSPEQTAFIGFGCTFGGGYFNSFANKNSKDRNYALNAKNSLLRKLKTIQTVQFFCSSYSVAKPSTNLLIYCDPPYEGVSGYKGTDKFNHEDFWNWVREKSTNNIVLVSEYKAPEDFEVIWEKKVKTDMNGKNGKLERIERLFKLKENN